MGILEKLRLKKQAIQGKPAAANSTAAPSRAEKIPQQVKKADTGDAYKLILRPILSEKGTRLAGSGQYVFAVSKTANKAEISKSIQKVYGVHVEEVKIINLVGKTRRYGRSHGRTAAWKKAIVKIRAGEKIPGIIEAVG